MLHSFSVSFKSGHRRGAKYRLCDSSLDAATTHFSLFVNELLLVTIGAGVAILLNWYMPSYRQEIERVREEIEDKMREVLLKMSGFLTIGNGKNDGEVLPVVEGKLNEARSYVRLEEENHLTKEVTYDYQYFEMRRDQSKALGNHGC